MKEDYLWDKTGGDPEIERLETALQAFRSRETAPPELPLLLPAKILPFRKEEPSPQPRLQRPRRIFSFAAAAAACLLFGVIALGVWLQTLNNKEQVRADLTEKAKPEIVLPTIVKEPFVLKNADSPLENIRSSNRFPARKISAIPRNAAAVKTSRRMTKAPSVRAAKPYDAALTKEEQYAYDQLMLALSITSSKFKLVKDKVEGTEEKTAVAGDGQ